MTIEIPGLSTVGVQHAERVEVPDLAELFNRRMIEVMSKINCCHLGTVRSFNSAKQTVTASINYKALVDGKLYEYPLLLDVPVFVLSGGGARITMPITAGDKCALLFNDRSIDNWLTTGDVSSAPNGERLHDLSDALCFVGFFPYGGSIPDYSSDGPEMKQGTGSVKVTGNGVQIKGGGFSFRTIMMNMFTDWLTHLVANALSKTHLATVFTALAADSHLDSATKAACTLAATNMNTVNAADTAFHGSITIAESSTDGVLKT